jgi:hypothetical protein
MYVFNTSAVVGDSALWWRHFSSMWPSFTVWRITSWKIGLLLRNEPF